MAIPLVSICLPNLNTRSFLEERMESILAQTVTDWELIICDSHSDDGSWEFFQKFKNDPRIQLHQVPREGIYAGWNECLRRTRGEYIQIATSDDTANPNLLERLLMPLQQFSSIDLAYCDFKYIDRSGNTLIPAREKPRREFLGEWIDVASIRDGRTEFLLSACFNIIWVTMTAVLFRRTLLDQVGLFRTNRGSQADLEWGLRALLCTDAAYIPDQAATWRVHEEQASSRKGYDWKFLRTTLECFQSVLFDPRSNIPPHWKQIEQWDVEIMRIWQIEYLDKFGLYRGIARRSPFQFLRNLWDALRVEPHFLVQQSCRGFPWRNDFNVNKVEVARSLISRFGGCWPPRRIPANGLGRDTCLSTESKVTPNK